MQPGRNARRVTLLSALVLACTQPEDLVRRVESLRARHLEPDPPPFSSSDLFAYGAALLYLVLPFVLGAWVGRQWREHRWARFAALAGPVVGPALMLVLAPIVPLVAWDLVLLGVIFGLGLALGANAGRRGWYAAGTIGIGAFVALVVIEGALHILQVPRPPLSENAHRIELTRTAMVNDDAFCAIASDPGFFAARRAMAPASETEIVHLGDSMVEGVGIPYERLFVSQLQKASGALHLDAGITGASPDFEYMLMRRRLAQSPKPRAIVLHLFPGNDASGLGAFLSCCTDGPLVETQGDGVRERCPTPSTRFSWRGAIVRPVPPYPVRIAATAFDLPRHLWKRILLWHSGATSMDFDVRFALLERIVRQMDREAREAGVPFGVVVMPLRQIIDPSSRGHMGDYEYTEEHARLFRAAVQGSGAAWFDAEPPFRAWLESHPKQGFETRFPGDPHFDAAGHAAYAEAIAPFVSGLAK